MNVIYENKPEPMELRISSRLSSLPHMHKEIEIIYVESGFSTAHADREITDINTGDIFIAFPNQVHFYERSVSGKYYVLILSPKVFFGIKDILYASEPTVNRFITNNVLKKYIKRLISSKAEGDISRCVGYANLIMSEILSNIELRPQVKSADGTLREIMDFCEQHCFEDISLTTVAEGTHLSRCYISHLFGKKLSMSFTGYINILRINAACQLLAETDKKISDISEDVGFGTIRSFNRAFMKIMDQTPQNYRSGLI